MKISAIVFWSLAGYFFVVGTLYAIWGLISIGFIDWSGGTPLGLCAVFCAMVAVYLNRSHRSQTDELPEDHSDANIDDGDPEMGHFSPSSWWPLILGGSAFLVFLGLAVGFWICFIGLALGLIGLVGWVFQYYRGAFAR